MTFNGNATLNRLHQNIIDKPYASNGKNPDGSQTVFRCKKETALTKPNIQINGPRRKVYMPFDIDRENGGLAWEDANLPIPTFVTIDPSTGHAHLVYEIEIPVWFPCFDDQRPEPPPVRYWKAVYRAMRKALNADAAYNRLTTKNPFHPSWRVAFGPSKPYTLDELARNLDLSSSRHATIRDVCGRRAILFDSVRYWAYREKSNYNSLEAFQNDIRAELERINASFEKGPEAQNTIKSIARSVSRWVWTKYTGDGDCKRRGIMRLDPSEDLQSRQQKGQAFSADIKANATVIKIRNTMSSLQRDGKRVTRVAVASATNLHRNTVARYWSNALTMVSPDQSTTLSSNTSPATVPSRCSLRSSPPAAGERDYLIPTELCISPVILSFAQAKAKHGNGPGSTIQALVYAARQAKHGILIDGLPETFKEHLQRKVDSQRV